MKTYPQPEHTLARDYGIYVGIAYGISWTLLIAGVKLGWSEETLNVSSAGPALAAFFYGAGAVDV